MAVIIISVITTMTGDLQLMLHKSSSTIVEATVNFCTTVADIRMNKVNNKSTEAGVELLV